MTAWRDCRILEFVFHDTTTDSHYAAMVSATAVIAAPVDGIRLSISNNEMLQAQTVDGENGQIRVIWNGGTPVPGDGDTMTIRCL